MKKKGFTLIELLAVIVILAIIALILVPIVSDVIETSRKQAFKESVNGIIDSTNNYLNEYILEHNNELDEFPVVFTCDGTSCSNGSDILAFKGNTPKSGRIIIQRDGVLAEYITDSKYCAYGYKWDMVVEKSCGDVDVTKPTITGTQSGKNVALTMTDGESGIDSYCATNVENPSGCTWVSVTSNSVNYEIPSAGTWYFYAKDKKGNISDSVSFTTISTDYCAHQPGDVLQTFSYTGSPQEFEVPCTGTYKLEVWGAQGGTASGQYGSVGGGAGGYSYGMVHLVSNETIYAVVGGQGSGGRGRSGSQTVPSGGYNGGGSGRENYGNENWGVAGGGGATHIGKTSNVLKDTAQADVYIVAGGGGGGIIDSWVPTRYYAGVGGGTEGTGGGGSQSAAGQGGGYGYGGNAGWSWQDGWQGGGGGGGYYGGGWHSYNEGKGGGGGSGYIGGVTDGETIAGNASMPTHDGTSTMTGNAGNGYAKITFISLN